MRLVVLQIANIGEHLYHPRMRQANGMKVFRASLKDMILALLMATYKILRVVHSDPEPGL